jgi:tRNA (guanine-N7-)-methyltransferase
MNSDSNLPLDEEHPDLQPVGLSPEDQEAASAESEGMEFQRKLILDEDLHRCWHLIYVRPEGSTKPLRTPDNQPDRKDWDWSHFFAEKRPVEIEVGSGKGGFMANYALAHPELNLLGAEIETKWAKYGASRLVRNKIPNAAQLRGDVFYFIRDYVKTASVRAVHMYFPDPWPKAYHRKRRLLRQEFLEELRRIVIPGPEALFHWGTDYQEYNESAREIMFQCGFMELVQDDAPPTDGIMTNFETKYRKEGRPIYRSVWRFLHSNHEN